jgi:hypothetical protein
MKKTIRSFLLLVLAVTLAAGLAVAPEASAKKKSALETSVENIVNAKVEKSAAKKAKLRTLFDYVTGSEDGKENFGYKGARPTIVKGKAVKAWTKKGWPAKFAAEMISKKTGSCYHYAAIYGYLAKKATGYSVRVCVGKTNGFTGKLQDHAWTEIKIGKTWYVCDTNLDKTLSNLGKKKAGTYFLKKRSSLKKTYNKYKKVKTYTVKF